MKSILLIIVCFLSISWTCSKNSKISSQNLQRQLASSDGDNKTLRASGLNNKIPHAFNYKETKTWLQHYESKLKENRYIPVKQLESKAQQGDAEFQFLLGLSYYKRFTRSSHKKALNWLEKASLQQHFKAKYYLARLYMDGKAAPQDEKKAIQLMSESATQGFELAEYIFGLWLNENFIKLGKTYPTNWKTPFYWVQKAARKDLTLAQTTLAYYYFKGLGTKPNLMKAWAWADQSLKNSYVSGDEKLSRLVTNLTTALIIKRKS
ncbi:MAG: tetratricopeptide repeat protein, partial [Bdellovibrionales bacterium]